MPNDLSRRRQRLPAEVRIHQILDAALSEFSRHGYGSARMEDIAQSAGLSKGGLYAHFPSKESLLEKLLHREVSIPVRENVGWWPEGVKTLEDLVEAFVDHTLQHLTSPTHLPTIRLFLAEAPRLPASMRDWHASTLQVHEENHRSLIQRAVQEGLLQALPEPLNSHILMVPLMHSLLHILASGEPLTPTQIEPLREQHKMLLLRLLRP